MKFGRTADYHYKVISYIQVEGESSNLYFERGSKVGTVPEPVQTVSVDESLLLDSA